MVKLSKEAKQRLQQLFKGGQFAIRWGFIPLVIYLGQWLRNLGGAQSRACWVCESRGFFLVFWGGAINRVTVLSTFLRLSSRAREPNLEFLLLAIRIVFSLTQTLTFLT